METFLFSELFLVVGVILGWTFAERYIAHMQFEEHEYEDLFENNPHPELFGKDGKIDRGDYMEIRFDPGFDPENFSPEDIELED